MNVIGALSMLVSPFLLFAVLKRLLGDTPRATLAVLLVASSPLYLFLLGYGHPFHLALVFLLSGWLLMLKGVEARTAASTVAWMAPGIVLHMVGLTTRFEQMVLTSAMLGALCFVHPPQRVRRVLLCGAGCGVAIALFAAAKSWLVPAGAEAQLTDSGFVASLGLLLLTLDMRLVRWGVTHLVIEVGIPTLFIGGVAFLVAVVRRNFAALLVTVVGVLPTAMIYVGNPSPPRHFMVMVMGLACLTAAAVSTQWVGRLQRFALPVLVLNLVLPWALIPVDGRPLPDRADIAFNAIERTWRNHAQIRDAFPFYRELVAKSEGQPVVVYASWIHIAQIMSVTADDRAVDMTRVMLADGVPALVLSRNGLELNLVETEDKDFIEKAVAELRVSRPQLRQVSFLPEAPEANDLSLTMPATLRWWTS
jgi:hypothetical protein